MIRIRRERETAVWEALWASDPRATVYQHPAWSRALARADSRFRPVFLLAEDGGEPVGGLPLVEVRRSGTRQFYSLPFGTYGGPILAPGTDARACDALARSFGDLAGVRTVVRELVLLDPDPAMTEILARVGDLDPVHETTERIDLRAGFDALWNHGYDRNTRNCVRMSERAGVEAVVETGTEALRVLGELYEEQTREWSRDTVQTPSTIEAVVAELGERARIHVARREGRPLMACLFLEDGRRGIHPWVSGGNQEARKTRASHLLYDRALRDACARGLAFWDFGGSLGNASIEFFKRSFGSAPCSVVRLHRKAAWFRRLRELRP